MTTHSAKGYKYLITANIEKVKLNIAFPVEMLILWKRGNQKIETKNKIIHCPKTGNESLINEELSMFACFQYSENNTVFIEKNVVPFLK